ncbi:adenylate/guanylate cyclase domain-containing protein [Mycobacterium sp. NPDC051804]|uniref:adenylate/guanylate cyclase domain-containing protein n=1 Tax=Mycobacterium sp. NPDC051804 TaxID=3364295 RepID=UPI00378FB4DA
MDRIWQWAWDRYGPRYSWVVNTVLVGAALPIYLVVSFVVLAFEGAGKYIEVAAVTVIAVVVVAYGMGLPGVGPPRIVEQWAGGRDVDPEMALEASYIWARRSVSLGVASNVILAVVLSVGVGLIAGANGVRLVQYGFLVGAIGTGCFLIAAHSFFEGALRPVRVSIAAETGIGDSLPRSRPSFAAWSNLAILAVAFVFAVAGAMLAAVFDRTRDIPVLAVAIGCAMTLVFALPMTVAASFSPSMHPIRDLAAGTQRVAAGDYSKRVPVVQDDDLGALAASFNRMQAGLAERQRLQVAFGTYVDPALATKLLEQGDDVFTGERREVTVMFVDIRDFTPFAEANAAEDVVARLNALFEIVVPAVVDAGGHVNKFLGDGALAVFGAPNDLPHHADAALGAAVLIQRLVAERFGSELRIGIGINSGTVIAGTIGGGSKLEFTLIGDTVNVAARVEQFTKTTGDTTLVTEQSADALTARPPFLVDRGSHALKGKSEAVRVFGLSPEG